MRNILRAVVALGLVSVVTTATAAPASAATRDIRIHFTNDSDSALTLVSKSLDHGCWGTEPPATVAIGQTVDIASESCGVLTGTEFSADYKLDSTGAKVHMHYDNPFAGEDAFHENAPQGYLFQASGVIENRTAKFGCDAATCDGIPDQWKRDGVTIDPGGGNPPQRIELHRMGVTLDRPNVMVQLDWMQDSGHNQQLRQAALDTVIRAFDQVPDTFQGATRPGITLIVDAGPDSTITPGGAKWEALSRARQFTWAQDFLTGNRTDGYQLANYYTQLRNNFVPTGRLPIFHHAVAAANIANKDSTSGLTTPDSLGFMVTLGGSGVGTQNEQTGTFMHELGHVLGLDHSGGEGNADNVNFKPNYPSIMNYAYQMGGVFRDSTQVFDYSRTEMPDVDETKLTEAGGVDLGSNTAKYGTTHSCATKDSAGKISITSTDVQATVKPVDWNCSRSTPDGGTGFDANGDTVQATLKGMDKSDWKRLRFKTGGVGAGLNAKDTVTVPSAGISPPHSELTLEQSRLIRTLPLTTTMTYNGVTTSDYHDDTTMSATLLAGAEPVVNRTITFRIGSSSTDSCTATTNAAGTAACGFKITQAPGVYPITASFGGDPIYKPATDSARTFTVTKEQTAVAYTGDVRLANGTAVNLSGKLTEDDGTPIAGVPVKLTAGTGPTQQSCTAATNASGAAGCTIASLSQPLTADATVPLGAAFAGDQFYLPSNASATGKLNYMTGRAFGVSADVDLPLVSLRLPAQPDTGPIRTAAASTTATPCSASLSTLLISARALCPNVTVTVAPGTSVGTSTVEDVTIGIPGLPVIKATAVRSTSRSTCAGAAGSVTIGRLTIGGVPIDTGTVTANSGIDLGTGVRLILNEQLPVPGADKGMTVNALHLTALGRTIDVVLGSSTSDIHNC